MRADIAEISQTFKEAMVKAGRGFEWPQAKDLRNTYQYRYFSAFLTKCREKDLDLEVAKEVVKSLVSYAKSKKILNKGAALLARGDVVEICIKNIERDVREVDSFVDSLRTNHGNIKGDSVDEKKRFLLRKPHRHGMSNLVSMRLSGKLSDSYIAVSKPCMKAFLELDDKDEMLTIVEYFKLRNKVRNKVGDDALFEILGKDFNAS